MSKKRSSREEKFLSLGQDLLIGFSFSPNVQIIDFVSVSLTNGHEHSNLLSVR